VKNKILFIGSIIFASHVALGEMLVVLPQASEMSTQFHVSFQKSISDTLVARGLDVHAANDLTKTSVVDPFNAALHTQMLSNKLGLNKDEIYSYIASQTLFQNRVDFRAYDDIVAMVQNIKGLSMQKEDHNAISEYIAIV
jgi:hypothetical protein